MSATTPPAGPSAESVEALLAATRELIARVEALFPAPPPKAAPPKRPPPKGPRR